MRTEKILVASTGHFPEEAYRKISRELAVMSRDEGDLIFIDDSDEVINLEDYHHNLAVLVFIAKNRGCHWIMFDRDEPFTDVVSSYEW